MYQIIWSNTAHDTYFEIIENLTNRWNAQVAFKLDLKVVELLDLLQNHKHLCPASNSIPLLRKCVINKYTSLIYRIDENQKVIELITFLDNRTDSVF